MSAVPESGYTAGRYVVAWVGADGARDPIALTSQVKVMRDGFERLGHKPALILLVVADGECDAAVEIISTALDVASVSVQPAPTHGRHCSCSGCAREDWTRADLGPCGMHGPSCPAVYAPIQPALSEPE